MAAYDRPMLESAAMLKTTRISVTVERALLERIRELTGKDVRLSALFSDALRDEIHRLEMIEQLNEWEREDPISPEDRKAGERLWHAIAE
ncbi:MAG: hypothetical protein QOD51_1164 [Candidatus Eremiobacteraeota bacterium]|jgi:post-segregation antitoxin (ccd killing protein)|nr:hypothetical protein [Candidatus Eremiobacteraeota bacterium]